MPHRPRHPYAWVYVALVVVAFSRPGVLAFAATFGLIFLLSAFQERRFAARELALAAFTAICGFAWPAIAALATGRADVYLKTELAWRYGYAESERFIPFNGVIVGFQNVLGGVFGIIILAIVVYFFVRVWRTQLVRDLGVVGQFSFWYLIYLAATIYPQSSTWRLVLPAFGLFGALRLRGWQRWVVIFLFTAGQIVWIWVCWMYSEPDFTPP